MGVTSVRIVVHFLIIVLLALAGLAQDGQQPCYRHNRGKDIYLYGTGRMVLRSWQ